MSVNPDCVFCQIVAGNLPCDKVFESDDILAFRDINPQAPTHILIVPKEHREKLSDYGEDDALLLGKVQAAAVEIAERERLSDFRAVINCGEGAGQEVFHLHLHLLGGRAFSWPPG